MRAVLSFHAIDDRPGPLSFPPDKLATLLEAVARANVPVVTLDTLLASERPGIVLTFDDGMASVHEAALPVLRAHGVPAHLFLTTSRVGGDNHWRGQPDHAERYAMLNWDQLGELAEAGVRIEAHTATHPDLRRLDGAAMEAEFAQCDAEIERRIGRRPLHFAYPYGFHDARVRAVAARRYKSCCTTELRYVGSVAARDAIPRLDSHYLRSGLVQRNLAGPAAHAYIGLRYMVRRWRGRS